MANQTFLLLLFCFPSNRRRRSAIGSGRIEQPAFGPGKTEEGGNESRPKSGLCKHVIALSVCCGSDFQIERKRARLKLAAVILDDTPRVWKLGDNFTKNIKLNEDLMPPWLASPLFFSFSTFCFTPGGGGFGGGIPNLFHLLAGGGGGSLTGRRPLLLRLFPSLDRSLTDNEEKREGGWLRRMGFTIRREGGGFLVEGGLLTVTARTNLCSRREGRVVTMFG